MSVKQQTKLSSLIVENTDLGSIPWPKMTEAERDAISSPIGGLTVYNTDTASVNVYNDVDIEWGIIAGAGFTSTTQTANYTAAAGDEVFADTQAGAFTVTLPLSPEDGDKVRILDISGFFISENLTVARNGELIQGLAEDLVLDVGDLWIELVYNAVNSDWRLVSPAVGESYIEATSSLIGLTKKNRWSKKILSAFVDGSVTSTPALPELTFNNLVIGKVYSIILNITIDKASTDTLMGVICTHDSINLFQVKEGMSSQSTANATLSGTMIFTASATTLTFDGTSVAATSVILGPGLNAEPRTFAILTELNNHEPETSDFD